MLTANDQGHRRPKSSANPSLLKGLVHDVNGIPFTPTHSVKKGRRYRYYTSRAVIRGESSAAALPRIPAPEFEQLVTKQIESLLGSLEKHLPGDGPDPTRVEILRRAKVVASEWSKTVERDEFIRSILQSVIIGHRDVLIRIDKTALTTKLLGHTLDGSADAGEHDLITLRATLQVINRTGKTELILPETAASDPKPIQSLIRAVARALDWYELIISGQVSTTEELARKVGLSSAYIQRNIACATLSPKIVEAILGGRQRPHLKLWELVNERSAIWKEQDRVLLPTPEATVDWANE
jgi:hypothetical protein